MDICMSTSWYIYNCLKVAQSQTAANPQHQEEETNEKN